MRTLPFKRTISAIQGKAALGLLAWAALLSGVALLPQSAPQAQSSPAPPQFCYPAGSQQCYDAQSKAEAALRAQPLPGGRVVAWRRTDGVQIASVYGRRQFIYAIPRESAEQLYAPSYWRIRSDSLASIAPGCTPSPDPNMPGTCADEGETVAKMMEAYRNARPDCTYTPPVVVSERPVGYRTVTYSATNPPYHGLVNYEKRIYRTTRSCPAGVAQLEFHIGKQASFTCHAGSQGLQDSSAYGDGKNDIELPALCQNDTKRAIDGPMLQVASCPANGNPCYPATGDKARFETDFEFAGRSFTRIYHSLNQLSAGLGMAPGWTHSLAIRLEGATSSSPTLVSAQGYYETFVAIGSDRYRAENSQDRVLERVTGAFPVFWRLRDGSGEVQEFNSFGRLIAWRRPDEPLRDLTFAYINLQSSSQGALAAAGWLGSVTDAQGRQLRFEYGRNGLLSRIVKPDGSAVSYGYDASDNLVSADYGAGRIKRYHYAEAGLIGDASQRHHLTGITAESGLRYASFRYDAQGRAIESRVLGTPNEVTTVAYDSDTRSTVTTADNLQRVYTLQPGLYRRITGASEAGSDTSQQYDASGRVVQRTDKRGVITQYEYTAGYRSAVIEAVGTPQQRREETDRDPATQRVLEMRTKDASGALVARSRYAYNARGQLISTTAYDPANGVTRTATLSYCESTEVTTGSCPFVGLVKAIDDPRTDVSDIVTFTYRQADHPDCATAPSTCAWRKGDLWKTTNAVGHVTEVLAYDGAGRVTAMRDPNGITTTLQYDPRGWLTRRTVLGDSAILFGDAVTRIDYTADGLVRKLTRPDGSVALFGYDAGQRLTTVADSDGNAIVYTLNAAGERIAERTNDATGGLTRELSRAFDSLGRLVRIVDANNAATVFAYDQDGNLTGSTDPLLRTSGSAYDALGRMTASLGNANAPIGAGDRAQILYVYDALDRLTRITDPKGLHTDYAYNGFGERTRLSSPDTGVSTYGYDAAGNQVTTTDARGVTKNVSYDALDRPTTVAYPSDGTQNVGFTYDTASGDCAAGETYLTGRLARMADASGSTSWCYDRYGQLTQKLQRTDNRAYALRYLWAPSSNGPGGPLIVHQPGRGKFFGWRYPDGAQVRVSQDVEGRVSQLSVVTADGRTQLLLAHARYHPFGAPAGWEWGNGLVHRRTVDRNYNPGIIQTGTQSGTRFTANPTSLSLGYQFDAVGNLIALRDGHQSEPALRTYGYDGLDRLTAVRNGGNGQSLQNYAYDATGNRVSRTDGVAVTSYGYANGSHRLDAVGGQPRGYDAAGNTVYIGNGGASGGAGGGDDEYMPPDPGHPGPGEPVPGEPAVAGMSVGVSFAGTATANATAAPALREFVYNAANRLSEVRNDGVSAMRYRYNGIGEQVLKFSGSQRIVTVYDEAGRWIGDYDSATGDPIQQAIWLHDLPVGLLVGSGSNQTLYYIEPDMLGTPRVVLNPANSQAVWRWDLTGEAFGDSAPNQDPDGDGTQFVLDMRFPGQRYDAASGMNYNYFRDYNPQSGRYLQSDPIGLAGGVASYLYSYATSLVMVDNFGLQALPLPGMLPPPVIPSNPGIGPTDYRKKLVDDMVNAWDRLDQERRLREKTYQTYTRYNPVTRQCYSGRTSGYGTPEENVRRRGIEQAHLTAEGFFPPILDKSSSSYPSIRGREQQLIEINGGARSDGGRSRNLINGISPWNPLKDFYLNSATAEFGIPARSYSKGPCQCI